MTAPTIPGMHRQSCSDEACGGCYPDPGTRVRVRTPGPKRDAEGLSRDQRRTKRDADLLAQGVHPATRIGIADGDHTCGDCAMHVPVHRGNTHAHKCRLHRLGMSHSADSDIRVSWPACNAWQEEAS